MGFLCERSPACCKGIEDTGFGAMESNLRETELKTKATATNERLKCRVFQKLSG